MENNPFIFETTNQYTRFSIGNMHANPQDVIQPSSACRASVIGVRTSDHFDELGELMPELLGFMVDTLWFNGGLMGFNGIQWDVVKFNDLPSGNDCDSLRTGKWSIYSIYSSCTELKNGDFP